MQLTRFLTEESIKLEMATQVPAYDEANNSFERWQQEVKETVLEELVDLLESAYRIGNKNKLLLDFVNREKKATTALGHNIAVPHIRSMQAKDFMLAFAKSSTGYEFDAPDNEPVHFFFVMAAPPYDDSLYLKAFKSLAEMLQYDTFRQELAQIESPGELMRAMRAME